MSVDLRVRPLGFRSRHARKAARSLVGKLLAEELPTSTKLEAVVAELKQMRARRHDSKAVIFSQYTRMLDLLTIRLSEDKIAVALHDDAARGHVARQAARRCETRRS